MSYSQQLMGLGSISIFSRCGKKIDFGTCDGQIDEEKKRTFISQKGEEEIEEEPTFYH